MADLISLGAQYMRLPDGTEILAVLGPHKASATAKPHPGLVDGAVVEVRGEHRQITHTAQVGPYVEMALGFVRWDVADLAASQTAVAQESHPADPAAVIAWLEHLAGVAETACTSQVGRPSSEGSGGPACRLGDAAHTLCELFDVWTDTREG